MRHRALSIALLAALANPVPGLSLLDRSPFVWPGFEANKAPPQAQQPATAPSELEFHAVYELSGKTHILVKDRRKNVFHWIPIGEEVEGMLPKEYNPDKDELLLAYDNQEKWLSLQGLPEASGTPVAVARPAAATPAAQTTASAPRRRVIRPSSSTRTPTRNVIRPATSSGGSVPTPRVPSRRSVQAVNPGADALNFVPNDPGAEPSSTPPDMVPQLPPGIQLPPPP